MTIAPNAGIIDFGTFIAPEPGKDGIQGQVPAPLAGQDAYVLTASGWAAVGGGTGTVSSVDASGGTTGLTFSGGPITTSGTLTLSGTLSAANGGTGQTSYTDGQLLIGTTAGGLAKATLTAGTGISVTNASGSITVTNSAPNQIVSLTGAGTTSISGSYPNFTITSNDQFVGTVTSVGGAGSVNGITLTGTVTSSGSLTLGGTLSGVNLATQTTGTLSVARGGTGETSYTDGQLLIGNATGNTLSKATLTAGSGITITNGSGSITIAATGGGTGTVTSVDGSGGTTGLTLTGGPITTSGTLTIGGTLGVANGGTGATTLTGVVIGNGTSAFTVKTNPSGAFVGTTDTQTVTGKTLGNYTETVFAVTDGATVNLDPNNGPIQTWTLGANRTPGQVNWGAGQSITLMVDDGSAFAITWTTLAVVWETDGGSAPTLATTGFTVIVLWKVGTTIYGARVGNA